MHPANDTRVAEAFQRLADRPADPQIATMPQDELAQLAARLHSAGPAQPSPCSQTVKGGHR
jgi:hypothetical protein